MQDSQTMLLNEDSTFPRPPIGVRRSVQLPHPLVLPDGMQKAFQVCRQAVKCIADSPTV